MGWCIRGEKTIREGTLRVIALAGGKRRQVASGVVVAVKEEQRGYKRRDSAVRVNYLSVFLITPEHVLVVHGRLHVSATELVAPTITVSANTATTSLRRLHLHTPTSRHRTLQR